MDTVNKYFLEAAEAFFENRTVEWGTEISADVLGAVFSRAQEQGMLPMIYETVYRSGFYPDMAQRFAGVRREVQCQVIFQASRTKRFLEIYQILTEHGICPLVVKGIICRNLYEKQDYRISSDEDLYVPAEQVYACGQLLEQCGLQTDYRMKKGDVIPDEITYTDAEQGVRLEVHSALFGPDDGAYSYLNQLFLNCREQRIVEEIDGVQLYTMNYTDHMLYLICHVFKHFLHSGFGVRQVCDIVQFANVYGQNIDWMQILKKTREVSADVFAATLFRIGEKYFHLDKSRAGMGDIWDVLQVNEEALLADLLESGVYGSVSLARKHSSTITLNAVLANKKNRNRSIAQTIFPNRAYLTGRYPFLKKYPFLLPAAWIARIWSYRREIQSESIEESAAKSVEIGKRRVELMKKYKILS